MTSKQRDSDSYSPNAWQERYRCPEHGATSWDYCVQCQAEHQREQWLLCKRLGVSIDPETVRDILREAGIEPVKPQSEPVVRDQSASGQSSQAASESVTSEPSGVVDDGRRVKSSSDPTTIHVSLAHNPSSK